MPLAKHLHDDTSRAPPAWTPGLRHPLAYALIVSQFEIVHTMTDYYDGPRGGIADFHGKPHLYESQFSDIVDDYTDIFHLSPVAFDIFPLALEQWAIWLRWEAAYKQRETPLSTHPALPNERVKYDELETILEQALVIDESNFVAATAEFRNNETKLEVRWTPADQTKNR